jgi:pseudaminic acid biosynthesis-associated methylase
MNKEFLSSLPKDIKILEVGANYGMQLRMLADLGFTNLYGVELNPVVAKVARETNSSFNIIEGNALDLPFKDNSFDLVFTSNVLIHIAPTDRKKAISEIVRCSKGFIWGFEYFNETSVEIPYRGNRNVLWKTDFPKLYKTLFPTLKLVQQKLYKDLGSENRDVMYLFKKAGRSKSAK